MVSLVPLLRGWLCGGSGGKTGGGSSSQDSTVITRPGLFEATPDVSVSLVAPGPAVSAAVTGPDKGVDAVAANLDATSISWQHSSTEPQQQQQQQPQTPPQQQLQQQQAWGCATSLYDMDPLTGQRNGDPIADCFACLTYPQGAVLALADGVNWGERPKQAARAAVHGFCSSLHQQLALTQGGRQLSSTAAFGAIRSAVLAAQRQVIAAEGTLTTLVGALVCPKRWGGGHVLLAVAVGDSPCYVWRAASGTVEEVTYMAPLHGFHRDPRVCPGCLGYAVGDQPDLSNITFSLTHLQQGDVVFLTSDGISDNFDPVMRKQCLATALPSKSPRASAAAQAAALSALNSHSAGGGIGSNRNNNNQQQQQSSDPWAHVNGAQLHQELLGSVSPAACHTRALNDMAKVLRCACDPQHAAAAATAAAAGGGGGQQHTQHGTAGLASSGGGGGGQQQQQPQQPQQQQQQQLNGSSLGSVAASSKSVAGELPAGFTAGADLTAAAAVDALMRLASAVTDAQRQVLEDAASRSSNRKHELADVLAGLPGKLDHACVVAYKVGSSSKK